jgi:hypothetical protein
MRKRSGAPARQGSFRTLAAAVGGLVLAASGACASPADPGSSGADWLRSHPAVDRSLVRAVNWPGTRVSRFEADAHGFRTVLKFPGDDSDMGAIAQVAPGTADPCKAMPYLI